jgi:uncharacterized membrane protein
MPELNPKQQVIQVSGISSITLIAFSIISIVVSFISVFLLKQLNLITKIAELPDWQILLGVGLLTFIVITILLFTAEKAVNTYYPLVEEKLKINALVIASLLVLVGSILACYFGLSYYLIFLRSYFTV